MSFLKEFIINYLKFISGNIYFYKKIYYYIIN